MKFNLNQIVNNKKLEIEKSIKEKELELNNINKAYEELEEFLLENGYEKKDEEDLLLNVISIIEKIKENLLLNEKDIEYIEESMKSLSNIKTNLLDSTVIESLKNKIKEINEEIDYNNQKILYINEYIEVLERIKSSCPICKSKNTNCSLCYGKEVTIREILNYENKKDIPKVKKEVKQEVVKPVEKKQEPKVKNEVPKENTYVPQPTVNDYNNIENSYNPQIYNHMQHMSNNTNMKPVMIEPIVVEQPINQYQNQYGNYQPNNQGYQNNNKKMNK